MRERINRPVHLIDSEAVTTAELFPKCPKCDKGNLVPFSRGQDIFEIWKCTNCAYTINKR
ncbi:MAG: zf-TFIIB domain-containing protein [Candidatus Thermoplasmatota archaeon]|nr:zf-TFIIB domain-containing protein [Candidatus Thermoplasmatota archaeon]